jgi:citrate synthase
MEPIYAPGLDDIIACETALSDVDGERGRLTIAGEDVESLASRAGFEATAGRLWRAAGLAVPDDLADALGRARADAFARLPGLGRALGAADGMDALRAAVAQLAASGDLLADALAATGAVAVFAAAWVRGAAGLAPIAPDPTARHSADLLHMVAGEAPAARARALDRYMVAVIDHGMSASTFAARVVASTGSDAISAVVAAIGALKGPLHGGAPGPVLVMLEAIGSPAAARAWLAAELAAGRRIMGMGHRIYRVRDPRAAVLERAVTELERSGAATGRLALARAVEEEATALLRERHPGRRIAANVEFYTAVLLDAIGLPAPMFTPTFAASRVAGWSAHVAEHRRSGRLLRPQSRYAPAGPAEPARAG